MPEMKLTVEETKLITELHRKTRELVHSIGQLEVQKARVLSELAEMEAVAQNHMNKVAERLEIPAGTPWHVQADGAVVLLPPQGAPPPAQ